MTASIRHTDRLESPYRMTSLSRKCHNAVSLPDFLFHRAVDDNRERAVMHGREMCRHDIHFPSRQLGLLRCEDLL